MAPCEAFILTLIIKRYSLGLSLIIFLKIFCLQLKIYVFGIFGIVKSGASILTAHHPPRGLIIIGHQSLTSSCYDGKLSLLSNEFSAKIQNGGAQRCQSDSSDKCCCNRWGVCGRKRRGEGKGQILTNFKKLFVVYRLTGCVVYLANDYRGS